MGDGAAHSTEMHRDGITPLLLNGFLDNTAAHHFPGCNSTASVAAAALGDISGEHTLQLLLPSPPNVNGHFAFGPTRT